MAHLQLIIYSRWWFFIAMWTFTKGTFTMNPSNRKGHLLRYAAPIPSPHGSPNKADSCHWANASRKWRTEPVVLDTAMDIYEQGSLRFGGQYCNRGTPYITYILSILVGIFHNKPSMLGVPQFRSQSLFLASRLDQPRWRLPLVRYIYISTMNTEQS